MTAAGPGQPECVHIEFLAEVSVARLAEGPDAPAHAFSATITAVCAGCGEPFVWIGGGRYICPDDADLPVGLSPRQVTVSVDGRELRAPLRPASAPEGWGEDGPSYHVEILGDGRMSGG
jgi:hypothetical protein